MPTLQTWGRTHCADATALLRPTREADVQEHVAAATKAGHRVRTHGALHSWSDAAMPSQIAMSLDALTGLVDVGTDTVTVRAGTRLFDLNRVIGAFIHVIAPLGCTNTAPPSTCASRSASGDDSTVARHC